MGVARPPLMVGGLLCGSRLGTQKVPVGRFRKKWGRGKMPTVLRRGPYRLFFYSNEEGEPPHIHVQRERGLAKFWLDPVAIASSSHFSPQEQRKLHRLVSENQEPLLEAWNDFFSG